MRFLGARSHLKFGPRKIIPKGDQNWQPELRGVSLDRHATVSVAEIRMIII